MGALARHDLAEMLDALDAGFAEAEADGGASAGLCVSLGRHQSAAEADELVDEVLALARPRVVALSIDGNEAGGSHTERFGEAFARAGAAGLRRCAHAGESSGPEGVREAIEVLGAERIDHGVRCVEDPSLVADLVERAVPLDICPTSNVVLGVVADLASHPLEGLRRAGVRLSLNTDDPLIYGIDLAGEYERCAAAFGWGSRRAVGPGPHLDRELLRPARPAGRTAPRAGRIRRILSAGWAAAVETRRSPIPA